MFPKLYLQLLVCWSFVALGFVTCQRQSSEWTNKAADIYFILDASSSVWIKDYEKQREFVADLVRDMDIGPYATRIGVGVFSNDHRLHIPINNNYSKEWLIREILRTPYLQGNTYISRALDGLRKVGLPANLTRPNVPHIAVLITDGMARHKQLTQDNASLIKQERIFLYTIGIGNAVNRDELRTMASDPKEDFSFFVVDFNHLTDIRETLSSKMADVKFLQADEGTCGKKTDVDTVFVYDESGVGDKDTRIIKEFLKSVAQNFSMNSGNVRMGVVSKTCHQGEITLGQYVTREDFSAALDNDDGPEISTLIKKVRNDAFLPEVGARVYAQKRIVLILHKQLNTLDVKREILFTKRWFDVQIFIIRLGTDYDKSFLNNMATSEKHVIIYDSADHLLRDKDKFLSSFCHDLP